MTEHYDPNNLSNPVNPAEQPRKRLPIPNIEGLQHIIQRETLPNSGEKPSLR